MSEQKVGRAVAGGRLLSAAEKGRSVAGARLLSVIEEYMFANSLIYLVDDGWELNRDSVRVLLRNYLSLMGRKRACDKSLSDKSFWSEWITAFEQKWSALTGKISKLPGQPTDEFLQLAKDVLANSLSKMNEGQRAEGRASGGQSASEASTGTAQCRRAGNAGDDEALYEVQRILAKRYNLSRKVDEYLIKWKLFDYGGNTWEPRDNLDCAAMLAQFERRWSALSAGEKQQLIDDRGNGRVYDKLLGDDTPTARKGRRQSSPVANKQKAATNKNPRERVVSERARRAVDKSKATTAADVKKGAAEGRGAAAIQGGPADREVAARGRKRQVAPGSELDSSGTDPKRGRGRQKKNELPPVSETSDSDESDVDSDCSRSDSAGADGFTGFSVWSVVSSSHAAVCLSDLSCRCRVPGVTTRACVTPTPPSALSFHRHDAAVAHRQRHLASARRSALRWLLLQWREQVESARKAAVRALVQAQLSEERSLTRARQLHQLHRLLQLRREQEPLQDQEQEHEEHEHEQEQEMTDDETTGDDTPRSRTRPRKPGHKPWLESYRRRMEVPVASPSRGRGRGGGRGRGRRGRGGRRARLDSESEGAAGFSGVGDDWLNRHSSADDAEADQVSATTSNIKSRKRKSSTALVLDSSLHPPPESGELLQQPARRKTGESAVNNLKRKAGARSSPLAESQNIDRSEFSGDSGSRWLNSSVGSVNETHTSDEEDVQKENGKPVIMVLPPVLPQYDGGMQWRAMDLDTRWGTVRVNVVPKRRERDGSVRELPKTVRKRVGLSASQHLLQPVQVVSGMVKYVRVTPAFSLLSSAAPAVSSPPKPPPSRVISVGRRHLIRDTSGKSILATFVPSGAGGAGDSPAIPFSRPVVSRTALPTLPSPRPASGPGSARPGGRLLTVKRPTSARVVTGARPAHPVRLQSSSIFEPADVGKVAGHGDQLPQLGSLEDELQLPAEPTSDKPQQNSDLDMLALICASESKHAPSEQPPHEENVQSTPVQQTSSESTAITPGLQENAAADGGQADEATLTGTVDEHGHVRIVLADGTTVVADLGDISAFEAPGLTGE